MVIIWRRLITAKGRRATSVGSESQCNGHFSDGQEVRLGRLEVLLHGSERMDVEASFQDVAGGHDRYLAALLLDHGRPRPSLLDVGPLGRP